MLIKVKLAWCYLQNDRDNDALQLCQSIDPEYKDQYDYHNLYAKVTYPKGDYETALMHLKKTVEILQTMESDGTDEVIPNQKRYEALYRGRRAMVLAILGRFEEAETFRANIEEVRGNWAKALELHCSGSERWPDDLDFVSGIRRMKRKDLGL